MPKMLTEKGLIKVNQEQIDRQNAEVSGFIKAGVCNYTESDEVEDYYLCANSEQRLKVINGRVYNMNGTPAQTITEES